MLSEHRIHRGIGRNQRKHGTARDKRSGTEKGNRETFPSSADQHVFSELGDGKEHQAEMGGTTSSGAYGMSDHNSSYCSLGVNLKGSGRHFARVGPLNIPFHESFLRALHVGQIGRWLLRKSLPPFARGLTWSHWDAGSLHIQHRPENIARRSASLSALVSFVNGVPFPVDRFSWNGDGRVNPDARSVLTHRIADSLEMPTVFAICP